MECDQFQKIVYFDRETICNSLQINNGGSLEVVKKTSGSKAVGGDGTLSTEVDLRNSIPFLTRLKFALSGKLQLKYFHEWTNQKTVTSTDISQFETIKDGLKRFSSVELNDIPNSLTSLRFAAAFTKMLRQNQDYNLQELSSLLEEMEGYDVFDIGCNKYIRFNQVAYLSNYKRHDLAMSQLDLYCIKVGEYQKVDFDFIRRIEGMQSLFDVPGNQKSLGDLFDGDERSPVVTCENSSVQIEHIALFDAVCAYISRESK